MYHPTWIDWLIAVVLLPLSGIYCALGYVRYALARTRTWPMPIVSVGNLTLGGSGKTPLIIALARAYARPAIVLRGYGRTSRGLVVVQDRMILCDVAHSGDEAMLYAQQLPHAVVIVSEVREEALDRIMKMGCDVVFLDDGYGKHAIKKLDLLIQTYPSRQWCLPSGPYRERLWWKKQVRWVREGVDFVRRVHIVDPTHAMLLVTAIARPERLDPYVPEVIGKVYFEDHHLFERGELVALMEHYGASSLLITQKDDVKIAPMGLPRSIMALEMEVSNDFILSLQESIHAQKN